MNLRNLLLASSILGFLFVGCTVDANVGADDPRAPAQDGGGNDSGTTPETPIDGSSDTHDGGSKDASTSDGDAGQRPADSCGVTFAQQGSWVDLEVVEEVKPYGNGGNIAPGIYTLTAIRSYLAGPKGTAEIRQTLEVKGSPSVGTFASLEEIRNTSGEFQSHPEIATSFTWEASTGVGFIYPAQACPIKGSSRTNSFTASATTLVITDEMTNTTRTYQKIQ